MAYVKKESYKRRDYLSKEDQKTIQQMLFGPYEPEWKLPNGIVDNSDPTIANRLNVETSAVSQYATTLMKNHFKKVTYHRNNNPWHLPEHLKLKR
jgi:hypothetical protein